MDAVTTPVIGSCNRRLCPCWGRRHHRYHHVWYIDRCRLRPTRYSSHDPVPAPEPIVVRAMVIVPAQPTVSAGRPGLTESDLVAQAGAGKRIHCRYFTTCARPAGRSAD